MKRGYKITAILLSVVLAFTSINLLSKAADDKPVPPKIVSFAALPQSVLEQTVYVGDDVSKIVFPSTLTATLETVKKIEEEPEPEELEVPPVIVPAQDEKTTNLPEATETTLPESTSEPEQEPESEPEPEQSAAPEDVDPEPAADSIPAPENTESSGDEENGDAGDYTSAVMKSLFPAARVYAAGLSEGAEGTMQTVTEQASVSVIWKIDILKSSGIVFSSQVPGNRYVYVPEVTGDYDVKAILPNIVVTVAEKAEKNAEVEPEEKQEEIDYPAFSETETVGGYSISIDAPEGVFPEGTVARIEVVSDSSSLIEGYCKNLRFLAKWTAGQICQ